MDRNWANIGGKGVMEEVAQHWDNGKHLTNVKKINHDVEPMRRTKNPIKIL